MPIANYKRNAAVTTTSQLTCVHIDNINEGSRVPPSQVPPTTPSRGLSGGAIAGIVVGVIVAVALVAALAFWFWRRRKRNQNPKCVPIDSAQHMETAEGHPMEVPAVEPPSYHKTATELSPDTIRPELPTTNSYQKHELQSGSYEPAELPDSGLQEKL